MEHYIGHQQVLIKDNLVIAVLVFNEHNPALMYETFQKFDYDQVVDLCKIHLSPGLGDSWDGRKFNSRPFPSWSLDENNHWKAPVSKPEDEKDYIWNEANQNWEEEIETADNDTASINTQVAVSGTPQ
jgi:hypothetical protein